MNVVQYLFEQSGRLEKDFVLGNKETLSFKDLYNQSSKMASYLSEAFGSENNIIIVSSNNSFFLVCYFGIMLSGNVCVPLNPSIEKKNFDHICDQSDAVAYFIEKRLFSKVNPNLKKTISDKEYLDLIVPKPNFEVDQSFCSERPAEIIFTSGSTGQPMGVVLSHQNIIANTNSIIDYFQLDQKDIIAIVLPFYYCFGLSLLHTHLRVGGAVVLNNNFMFIGTVIKDLNKYKCTGFAGVPSHYQILLRKSDSFKNTDFPSLRYVAQAGGKLHNCFIEEFIHSFPEIDFYVMYGQTEATARLSYLEPRDLKNKLGSIGKGIPGVQLKVVNALGQKVKPGEVGEIIAKGANVMLGYYKDTESTNKVLKDGWLYTGDIGTIDEDEYIYLNSRKKEIIKVAGKRVSPKEIEEVIVSFPDVVDCTIESFEDEITGEAIKAIVILKENSSTAITEETIRSYCGNKLVQYKVPKVIKFSKNLKVNSSGKKVMSSATNN